MEDYCEILSEFLKRAITPNGWGRWNLAVWTAGELQGEDQAKARDMLMQLVSIAPQPKSYTRWNTALTELRQRLGRAYCVSCVQVFSVDSLTHRQSARDESLFSGLLCQDCCDLFKAGTRWPVCLKGLPLLANEWDYERLQRAHR